uniref:Uncharacterized protein n=1 Tax=Noctiluca scintillans TaxID=2966 RepID=A0A7S1AYE2_NOCSC|mmetsp:Transcript_64249/g.170221  ORF Transcript_64249/g.170221 Transcript_64249/m.170221 type:complete len:107 (+) Transcript_64249:239-559(+)
MDGEVCLKHRWNTECLDGSFDETSLVQQPTAPAVYEASGGAGTSNIGTREILQRERLFPITWHRSLLHVLLPVDDCPTETQFETKRLVPRVLAALTCRQGRRYSFR